MFEVGRRFRCMMRVDCGQLDPGAMIRQNLANGPRTPERLDEEELACRLARRPRCGYQLAALIIGARLAGADAEFSSSFSARRPCEAFATGRHSI
jgi:hypothetical protein